jgi:hypothetical protein
MDRTKVLFIEYDLLTLALRIEFSIVEAGIIEDF